MTSISRIAEGVELDPVGFVSSACTGRHLLITEVATLGSAQQS